MVGQAVARLDAQVTLDTGSSTGARVARLDATRS